LFYELPKSRHDEFAVLFGGFVGDGAERIKEYAGGLFICLRGCAGVCLNASTRRSARLTVFGTDTPGSGYAEPSGEFGTTRLINCGITV
jgi:hypothetical protein